MNDNDQEDLFGPTNEEQTEEQAAPSFADMLYALVSDAVEREGIKQIYKELVMVTKDVEVLVEMHIADAYQTSRAEVTDDALPEENDDELESDITPSDSYDVDYVEDFSDEKEIVESLKDKIRRWLK